MSNKFSKTKKNNYDVKSANKTKKISNVKYECFYMAKAEFEFQVIYDAVKGSVPELVNNTEYWEISQVIEIETGEKRSIDIENIPLFRDEEDKKFLEENEIVSIYSVTFSEEDKETVTKIFKTVVEKTGGFLCSDTEDFKPYLVS